MISVRAAGLLPSFLRRVPLPTPAVLVPALVLAFWPVWRWYAARMSDRSDEPLGLLALVTAAAFLPRRGWCKPLGTRTLVFATAALTAYVVAFPALPMLARSALAILAIACVLPRHIQHSPAPRIALFLLSLPLLATLQFYLGFPARAITTWCAAHLLTLAGTTVAAEGTLLRWAGEEILVDAPCSGIRMLWTACYLSATLAAVHRLPARSLLRLGQATAAVVFAANLARTIVLFHLETGLWPNPPWAHETAGLILFAVTAGCCALAARALRARPARVPA